MKNIFNQIKKEELQIIVSESRSIKEVFHKLEICISGAQYRTFKREMKKLGISIVHFDRRRSKFRDEIGIDEFFQKDTNRSTSNIRKKILKFKLIEYKCNFCDNIGIWNNKPITLQIDHIDGDRLNNLISNLRFLCPNCHTQTETYAGKRFRISRFCSCGSLIARKSIKCKKCVNKPTKIIWPTDEELKKLIWKKSTVQLSKELGVSDKAIEKRCKKLGIKKPPIGYWNKEYAKTKSTLLDLN